jgi:hypothetical protein
MVEGNVDNLPDLFSFSVSSDESIDHRGFASFCMDIIFANGIYFDVFGIIDVNELFIDV